MSRIIVITAVFFLLGSCSTINKTPRIKENCLKSVVTWGDVLDCSIKLDEAQK